MQMLRSESTRYRRTVGMKFALIVSFFIAAISVFIFLFFPHQQEETAIAAMQDKVASIVRMTSLNVATALYFEDEQGIEEALRVTAQNGDIIHIAVRDQYGNVVRAFTRGGDARDYSAVPEGVRAAIYKVSRPISVNDNVVGQLELIVSLAGIKGQAAKSRGMIAFISVIIFVLGFVAVLATSAVITRPLGNMVETAQQIAAGDLTRRANVSSRDELGYLASVINQMLVTLENAHRSLQEKNTSLGQKAEELESEITDRKRIQSELQEAMQAARDANRAKGEFLANISHELRTPMTGIIGATDMLPNATTDEARSECVDIITQSAQAMMSLINDLLYITKLESGRTMLSPREFGLHDSLNALGQRFSEAARQVGLEFSLRIEPAVPKRVVADRERLEQVLSKLVENAIKFTTKGRVDVEVALDPANGASAPGRQSILFSVRDTGVGVSPEKKDLIFDTFTQADGSATRRFEGTGLGLAIAKQLVDVMGGRIWVDSEVGKGSVFYFTTTVDVARDQFVDLADPPEAPRPIRMEQKPRSLRVLLVEDNVVNQRLIIHMLTRRGFEVELAEDGQQAIDAFGSTDVDLILMDVQMPVMDGLAATRAIRQQEAASGSHIPIIAMTAYAHSSDRGECLAAGMDEFLSKPLTAHDLYKKIDEVMGSPATTPPGAG